MNPSVNNVRCFPAINLCYYFSNILYLEPDFFCTADNALTSLGADAFYPGKKTIGMLLLKAVSTKIDFLTEILMHPFHKRKMCVAKPRTIKLTLIPKYKTVTVSLEKCNSL